MPSSNQIFNTGRDWYNTAGVREWWEFFQDEVHGKSFMPVASFSCIIFSYDLWNGKYELSFDPFVNCKILQQGGFSQLFFLLKNIHTGSDEIVFFESKHTPFLTNLTCWRLLALQAKLCFSFEWSCNLSGSFWVQTYEPQHPIHFILFINITVYLAHIEDMTLCFPLVSLWSLCLWLVWHWSEVQGSREYPFIWYHEILKIMKFTDECPEKDRMRY